LAERGAARCAAAAWVVNGRVLVERYVEVAAYIPYIVDLRIPLGSELLLEPQAELLCDVYGRAGIAPANIDYYEAHGTGTAVGDPLETRAIGDALGRRRSPNNPLPIGSVKGNLGHLEAAAGMAGLVKVLHVLRDRVVPPNIHLNSANPAIDLTGWNLAPVTESFHLASDRRLVIGVSAFGFGGTNAHAVLTSFEPVISLVPKAELPEEPAPAGIAALLLSARSPAALRTAAQEMAHHLRSRPELQLRDILHRHPCL